MRRAIPTGLAVLALVWASHGRAETAKKPAPKASAPKASAPKTAAAPAASTVARKGGRNPFLVTPSPRIPLPVGPQVPKGQRFTAKPKTEAGAKEIVIAPKGKVARYPFEFQLEKRSSGLALVFKSSDPQMVLNPKGTFAIQLNVDEPVEVTPDVITGRDWESAGGKELSVQVTGKPEGEEPAFITGEASFTVCHAVTKQCQKKRNLFRHAL